MQLNLIQEYRMPKYNTIKTRAFFILPIFFITMFSLVTHCISYKDARERLKTNLCIKQGGLMNNDAYLVFIEPYLQKADQELAITKHFQTKQDLTEDDEAYMLQLLNFNVATFYFLNSKRNRIKNTYYNDSGSSLKKTILSIKNKNNLDFDIESEFISTSKILIDINQEFYKKLGIWKKASLFVLI